MVEVPVQKHVQVPMVTTVQKEVDVPQVQIIDKIVEVPVQKQMQVPMITKVTKEVDVPQSQTIEKIVEVPYIQTVEKIVEVPQVGATVQGNQRSVTQQLETMRQMAPAETVQEVVDGPPMPMESMTPVLKASAGDMMGAMSGQVGGVDLG